MKISKTLLIAFICIFCAAACSSNQEVDKPNLTTTKPIVHDTNAKLIDSVKSELEEAVLYVPVEVIEQKKINIRAIGDIMLGRGVAPRLNGDYTYPFKEVAQYLQNADITFANLESTLSTRGNKLIGKGVWLSAEPEAVEGIKFAGIDIVNIANNHILDYNEEGMLDTIDVLNQNGIHYIGAGKNLDEARHPAVIEVNGIKVGFLGYTDLYQYGYGVPGQTALRYLEAKENIAGVSPLKYNNIKEDIQKLRQHVDILVVSMHWGIEESFDVPPEQQALAHQIIDDGADLILGHHPHQMQGMELYNGKPIIYSMGNFIFDQNDKENNETMIADIEFTEGELTRFKVIPLKIIDKKQTVFAKGEDAKHIIAYLEKLSDALGTVPVASQGGCNGNRPQRIEMEVQYGYNSATAAK